MGYRALRVPVALQVLRELRAHRGQQALLGHKVLPVRKALLGHKALQGLWVLLG
jgi:hypothetical protein